MCLCPALRSRTGLHAHGPHGSKAATYCVRDGTAPPYTNRKARTTIELSGFYNAALTLAVYGLRAALAGALRNTRFRVAANLSRAGLITRQVSMSCFTFVSSLVT